MNILNQILQKKKEYEDFMNAVDLQELEQFSREELTAFTKAYHETSGRYIISEVNNIIKRKKQEEYPELLGVHHYPELKDIDFLTEEQLIKLDNHLAKNRGTHTSFSLLGDIVHWNMHEKIYEWLLEKGILIRKIHLKCSCDAGGSWLSKAFDETYKEQWIADLKKSNEEFEPIGLLTQDEFRYFGYCDECDNNEYSLGDIPHSFLEKLQFHHFYVKVKDRNTSLDHV